jgi:hypothetical protein
VTRATLEEAFFAITDAGAVADVPVEGQGGA